MSTQQLKNRERGESALEKLKTAKMWAGFHGAILDPSGEGYKEIETKIAEVEKYLNDIPEAQWPSKIDGLWHQAEQTADPYLP